VIVPLFDKIFGTVTTFGQINALEQVTGRGTIQKLEGILHIHKRQHIEASFFSAGKILHGIFLNL